MAKTRILIAGIGGVGGYFGGLLCRYYAGSDDVAINFLARGNHLKAIQTQGLKIVKGDESFITRPHLASEDPEDLGAMDYIILCTKSYDLEDTVRSLRPCLQKDTIILPLLNGVDSRDRIVKLLPDHTILEGCVYIVSRLAEDGLIVNSGNVEKLFFGLEGLRDPGLATLEQLLQQAHIDATLSLHISQTIWEKFIFISPTATATSYFDQSIGAIVADAEHFAAVRHLVAEVIQLARAKHISLPGDIAESTIRRMETLSYETTSSMHSDFRNKKRHTELDSLTGYVVKEAHRLHIPVPVFDRLYQGLKNRTTSGRKLL